MITGKHLSLSRRLLIGLVIVSFAYWAVVIVLSIRDNADELNELYDIHLSHSALALLRVTSPNANQPVAGDSTAGSPTVDQIFDQWPDLPKRTSTPAVPSDVTGPPAKAFVVSKNVEYGKRLIYQAWRNDGHLLYRSVNAPNWAMTDQLGFSDTLDANNQGWRHYSIWDRKHQVHVIVSEPHKVRSQQVNSITLNSISPIALGLPILIWLLWFSIKRGLIPLKTLSQEIASRKPDSLTLLDESKTPKEIRPIVLALNHLLQRMAQALESERRFTDNAAHELRTPLAAIQAQLFAVKVAQTETERLLAIGQLQFGIEKSIRLVGQMLTLARLDPEQSLPDAAPLDMGDVTQATGAELAPLTLPRDQTIELSVEPHLPPLVGNADMLAILLRNLLDNAIRYTPSGGHISIDVCRTPAGLQLTVSDDGPGIPAEQRERVFERFYRLAKQEQPGTGLGLAICRRIAQLHDAQIVLTEGPGKRGVSAIVTFALSSSHSHTADECH